MLVRLGQWDEAERRLRRAVSLDASNPTTRINLARVCLQTGARETALTEARAAYELSAGSPAARRLLAAALFENGLYGDAARELAALIQEDPASPQLRHSLILSLYKDGRLDEAARAAEEASHRLPDESLLTLWRARLAVRRGRMADAIDLLAAARRVHAPVDRWLREVDDLKPLRDDPRVRGPAASP